MGCEVVSREYRNGYKPEIVDWYISNVGDWQSLILVCNFAVESWISQSSGVQLLVGNIVKREDGKNWGELGFDIGDTVVMATTLFTNYQTLDGSTTVSGTSPYSWTGRTITNIQGDEMTLSGSEITQIVTPLPEWELNDAGSFNRLPFQGGKNKTSMSMRIYVDKKPQGISLDYTHIENADADSGSLNSFIDGSQTRFIALNTDTLTGWQLMERLGIQSGMSVQSANWLYNSKIGTHTYRYHLQLSFMNSSFLEDLSNFETMTAPSQTFNANSLTDSFQVIGYPEWNNPNVIMKSDPKKTKRLGNTGWFNENFNGLDNDFTVKSVEYFDELTGVQIQKLSYGGNVRVRAVIGGIQNLANGLSKFGLGFIWLPEEEGFYKNLNTPFHQNLMVNTAGEYNQGVFSLSGAFDPTVHNGFTTVNNRRMDVKNVRFSQSGTDVIYEATFVPSALFYDFINSLEEVDRNYAIWISVADRTLVTNFSNRVSLLLDYNTMERFIPPVGEWQPMEFNFYEHPDSLEDTVERCMNDFFVEDDVLAKVNFNVDITDVIPFGLEFAFEVENITTGEKYNLQSYKVNLSQYPVDGNGVPQWDFDASRGFKYIDGYEKNWVKVRRNASADFGTNYGYEALYGFKIRWEDWILRTGVPGDFFDTNEEHNGFNNKWFHYLMNTGWKFQFTVYLDAIKDNKQVRYVNSKPFTFKNYNSNPNLNKTWNFYRELDGSLMNAGVDPITGYPMGVILDGEHTRIEVLWEKNTGTWSSANDVYGTICIEVDRGTGQMEFRQISSIWGREPDCPLIPIPGQSLMEISLVSSIVLKFECLVEPSLLIGAVRYKVTARIGCNYKMIKNVLIFTDGQEVIDENGVEFLIAE